MLTAGLVAIGLLMGSRGEAPRETKFQGALLAQADVAPVNDDARQREINELLRTRPTFRAGAIVLGIGGGVTTLGAVGFIVGFTSGGIGGILFAGLAAIVGIGGLIVVIVGIIMVIATAAAQGDVDIRIEALRMRPSLPSEPPPSNIPPPAVMLENQSSLVLARF